MRDENKELEKLLSNSKLNQTRKILDRYKKSISFCKLHSKGLDIFTNGIFAQKRLEEKKPIIQKELLSVGIRQLQIIKIEDALKIFNEYLRSKMINRKLPEPGKENLFLLSVIELLMIVSGFETKIKEIREKYKIDPKKTKKELSKIIPEKNLLETIMAFRTLDEFDLATYRYFRDIGRGWYKNEQKIINAHKKLYNWEAKKFPHLSSLIKKIRATDLEKIPYGWTAIIKNYILYNEDSGGDLAVMRAFDNSPEFNIGIDKERQEPHIEIKIYGDTNINALTRGIIKKSQKILPTYKNMNKKMRSTTLRRWAYYYLRKKAKLNHKDANNELIKRGFDSISYQYGSQELKRFEETFK